MNVRRAARRALRTLIQGLEMIVAGFGAAILGTRSWAVVLDNLELAGFGLVVVAGNALSTFLGNLYEDKTGRALVKRDDSTPGA